ncbi:MAG: inositol monophosphatase family protein [Acidobacteriota bacterium]
MTTSDAALFLRVAVDAALAGAQVAKGYFSAHGAEAAGVRIENKSRNDLVSIADRESEAAIIATIRAEFPDHLIVAEESGLIGAHHEVSWIIDPLDGTTNFLQGLPIWCVSVACVAGDDLLAGVVFDPMSNDLFAAARGLGATRNGEEIFVSTKSRLDDAFLATGFPFRANAALDVFLDAFRSIFPEVRGIRRCGAAALDLAHVAAGVYDAFFEFRLSPWDVAAGALIVREAGGVVSDLDGGTDYLSSGNIVAGTPGIQLKLLGLLRKVASQGLLDELVPLD